MNFKKILAVAAIALSLASCSSGLSSTEAKDFAQKFINEDLLSGGMTAEVTNAEKGSGFWNLDIKLSDGREVKSLLSLDGKIFVPEAIYVDEVKAAAETAATAQTEALANLPKSAKPVVELFVMSYCPYGTQAEKAIIPAIEALGDSVDFQLKFVNYAMHGEKEVTENLLEYALAKNYPDKLIPYLKEFLKASDSTAALAAVGVSPADLAATIAATDKEFQITENLNNQDLWRKGQDGTPTYPNFNIDTADNEKYSIQGSPTLIINGQAAEGDRTPAAMLATICAAFETAPESCATELSSASPSAGFGEEVQSAGASGGECS
ncbi:MAG: hypothetical protein WCV72_02475 [Patescibacteria group bacterium]|jgi:hypothetical protein